MSGTSTFSAEAALEAMIARCRRRAGLVLLIRYSLVACAATLATVSMARVLPPERISETTLGALAIGLGGLCVVAAAIRRYPTPREVAAAIDRHFDLNDSVVAALQARHGNTTTVVAPLIVRQAVERTADIHARDVFPLDLRRPALILAASLVLVVASLPSSRDEGSGAATARSTRASGGGPGAPTAGTQAQQRSNSAGQGSRNSFGRSDSGTPATVQPGVRETEIAAAHPESFAGAGKANQSPATGDAGTALQSRNADSERTPAGNGAGSAGGGHEGIGASGIQATADSTGSGGGGVAKGASRGTGSGGVRAGDLLAASRQSTPPAAARFNEQPTRYGAAQRNAEAALSRGDIPPELRSYVREYFRAITR